MKAKVRLPEAYKEIIRQEATKQCRQMLDSLCEEHDAMLLLALSDIEGWKHVPFVRLMKKMKELKTRFDAEADLFECEVCDAALAELSRRGIDLKRIYRESGIEG